MSGDLKCPACVIRVVDPGGPGEWRDPSCTGRAGCVRHPDRETPAPESGPAGADVPVGKDDIVERRADDGWRPVSFTERAAVVEEFRGREPWRHMVNEIVRLRKIGAEKEAEIARLRAEVERLTGERDEAKDLPAKLYDAAWSALVDGHRTKKAIAAGCSMLWAMAELIPDFSPPVPPHEQSVREARERSRAAVRAALATRVAEDVREVCVEAAWGDEANVYAIQASARVGNVDLAPIVAAALADGGDHE